MTKDLVEIVATRLWNERPRIVERLELLTTTERQYLRRGTPILWDDDDMLECDKHQAREEARAAIAAVAEWLAENPTAYSPEQFLMMQLEKLK